MSGRYQLAPFYGSGAQPHSYIGPKLRQARVARGLTTTDMAAKLGFPVALIEAIERGQTEDQFPAVLAITIELELELKGLFGSAHTSNLTSASTNRIRLH